MTIRYAALVAAGLAVALCPTLATAGGYHPPVYIPPVVYKPPVIPPTPTATPAPPSTPSKSTTGQSGGGGAACTGGCVWVAGFIVAVATAIVVHELRGPACASKTKYNVARGYDHPTFWRPLCRFKRDPAVKSAKFMPHGK